MGEPEVPINTLMQMLEGLPTIPDHYLLHAPWSAHPASSTGLQPSTKNTICHSSSLNIPQPFWLCQSLGPGCPSWLMVPLSLHSLPWSSQVLSRLSQMSLSLRVFSLISIISPLGSAMSSFYSVFFFIEREGRQLREQTLPCWASFWVWTR